MENWLHSGISMDKLIQKYTKFKGLPFPEPPDDDDLYDLYSELVEYDAYVAGIVSSFISGKKVDRKSIYIDEELNYKFDAFSGKRYEKILSQYKLYYEKIHNLITMVIFLYDHR